MNDGPPVREHRRPDHNREGTAIMATKAPTVEYDEAATCWHLLVTTEGGKVSMLQNLDAPTARQAYRGLRPDEHPVEYANMPESGCFSWCGGSRIVRDGDVKSVKILGPEGAELEPWRGVKARVVDLAPEREREEYHQRARDAEKAALNALKTADDVIAAWFARCVATYSGVSEEARELYDGVTGQTLKRFANQHAPDGVHIRQKDMERWLDRKGVKSRGSMFAKRYDGIQRVLYGDVRSGNYGT